MELNNLTAISPIDGRYRKQSQFLGDYFSEFALIKYRVFVEVQYFIFLSEEKIFKLPAKIKAALEIMANDFSIEDAKRIKEIEATTNHDVKAVEYFIKEKLDEAGGKDIKEWVHFGLTSQDINNTSIPLSWKDYISNEYLPSIINLQNHIRAFAKEWRDIPMLARTHGQPASPTRLGKELMVFVERLDNQIALFSQVPFTAKFGGATGNFNAHNVAFPKKDWIKLGNQFVEEKLELQRQQFTTQIEHYDNLAAHFDAIRRINTILLDFCKDIWTYISLDYFKQKIKAGEVGSSAMPHKVNPIDYENAEGNLGIANALLTHLSEKLPISRMQRDLTDSTVLRNLGVPMAHVTIAINSIEKGLGKIVLHEETFLADLEKNWAVVAEAIQTILRRENYPNPYEALKALTRGKAHITEKDMHKFVKDLDVSESVKKELMKITPQNYVGINPEY
ncbi:adenylosuccinate lyase [Rhizosphaericola mali]|uniref:Adenylosuccinate lyase n=1 Tax=Rhizosphaericola mali TaxID=2545455 RepID=A0A5P2G1W7_9BACT|nr:adenylosuccinate lyase [Rhizosphaericola mali]QES89167.1 adenylosuccinate lyase [Rhizosphaericola mali]